MPGSVTVSFLLAIALVAAPTGVQAPRKPEALLTKLLRIMGLAALPSRMRAPGDSITTGDVWIVDFGAPAASRPLTAGGGYRSPIVLQDATALLALHDSGIVRIQTNAATERVLVMPVKGVRKLVGVDTANPSELVVLLEEPLQGSPLAVVSLETGKMAPLAVNDASDEERRMIERIRGENREYPGFLVYTQIETKRGVSRPVAWSDVFVKRGNAEPENVTRCSGANCTQPSLSPDGRVLAFIKSSIW